MKSNVITKQFIDLMGRAGNTKLQNYLDGDNKWKLPIMEEDIIQIQYSFSTVHSEAYRTKNPTTGILLLHRIPVNP